LKRAESGQDDVPIVLEELQAAGAIAAKEKVESDEKRRRRKKRRRRERRKSSVVGFKLHIRVMPNNTAVTDSMASEVLIRWVEGHDAVLFESLFGMLKRKLLEP
jgi:hypothetical protein